MTACSGPTWDHFDGFKWPHPRNRRSLRSVMFLVTEQGEETSRVELFEKIRRDHRDGASLRSLVRTYGVHRSTATPWVCCTMRVSLSGVCSCTGTASMEAGKADPRHPTGPGSAWSASSWGMRAPSVRSCSTSTASTASISPACRASVRSAHALSVCSTSPLAVSDGVSGPRLRPWRSRSARLPAVRRQRRRPPAARAPWPGRARRTPAGRPPHGRAVRPRWWCRRAPR